jgi:hypothetical protein
MDRTVREEGFASLYKGLGPALVTTVPYIALQMTFYDVAKRQLPVNDGVCAPGHEFIAAPFIAAHAMYRLAFLRTLCVRPLALAPDSSGPSNAFMVTHIHACTDGSSSISMSLLAGGIGTSVIGIGVASARSFPLARDPHSTMTCAMCPVALGGYYIQPASSRKHCATLATRCGATSRRVLCEQAVTVQPLHSFRRCPIGIGVGGCATPPHIAGHSFLPWSRDAPHHPYVAPLCCGSASFACSLTALHARPDERCQRREKAVLWHVGLHKANLSARGR